ncbi:hypothetical protein [Novosphingobium sp. YAF33]|uniref:hypothetical protein n=1 Tax=Novosphingobium sp. YAF33 TaxID=3233082 RepID=UPI003F9BD863
MADDYAASAKRHSEAASDLAANAKYDNAGYLIGYTAECAIKHKMRQVSGQATERIEGHCPNIMNALRLRIQHRGLTGQWLQVVRGPNPLSDWEVDQRYASNGHVTKEKFEDWQKFANRLMSLAGIK